MLNLNFVLLQLLLVTTFISMTVEMSSRWTSVIPMSVTNHGNVSVLRRDFRFDANSFIYETSRVNDDNSIEEHSGNNRDRFLKVNKTADKISFTKLRRLRRSENKWIESYTVASRDVVKMHAFIVKDEEIPDCGTAANLLTKTRYYICSGVVLTDRHILTSATCMNKAVFYDYQIHAEVAVLVGDLIHENYVLKVLDYVMHPKYDPNPASSVHELNNLAVMSLSCPIPDGKIAFPKLPSQKFDDLAHTCCADKCSISSVFRLPHNRYILQSMMTKHIPTFDKVHGKDFSIGTLDDTENFDYNSSLRRSIRDNQKAFISQFHVKQAMDQIETNKSLDIRNEKGKERINSLPLRVKRDTSKDNADLPSYWFQVVQEINAGNVSEKSQNELKTVLKVLTTNLLEKIINVLSSHIGDVANAYPYFLEAVNSDNVTKKVEQSLMNYLSKAMERDELLKSKPRENESLPNVELVKSDIEQSSSDGTKLNDTTVRSLDATVQKTNDKMEFFCPPIGTPIIKKNTLIGLIVYTCDEVQNWVAWKYVEIVHNTEWIRKQVRMINYDKIEE